MEYMKNGCLLDLLRDEGYLSEAKAQKWYKQILEALTYIHERGITHRFNTFYKLFIYFVQNAVIFF